MDRLSIESIERNLAEEREGSVGGVAPVELKDHPVLAEDSHKFPRRQSFGQEEEIAHVCAGTLIAYAFQQAVGQDAGDDQPVVAIAQRSIQMPAVRAQLEVTARLLRVPRRQ